MDTTIPAELLELKARFDHWRATRKYKHQPIPDDLRSAALELDQRYSSSLLERILKIQLWSLRRRGASKAPARARLRPTSPKSSKAAFFKLPTETVLPTAVAPSSSNNGYRLLLERPDGTRLTITLPLLDPASIQRLCADFLRG
jgi:hypothetical protein